MPKFDLKKATQDELDTLIATEEPGELLLYIADMLGFNHVQLSFKIKGGKDEDFDSSRGHITYDGTIED